MANEKKVYTWPNKRSGQRMGCFARPTPLSLSLSLKKEKKNTRQKKVYMIWKGRGQTGNQVVSWLSNFNPGVY